MAISMVDERAEWKKKIHDLHRQIFRFGDADKKKMELEKKARSLPLQPFVKIYEAN